MSTKHALVLLAITVIGGLLVWVTIESTESEPRLEFQQAEVFTDYTDIIVRSGSSKPFAAPEILWPALSGFERPKVR
jgi:hypothetical protein